MVSPFYVTEGTPFRPEVILWLEMPDELVLQFRLIDPKEPPVSFGSTLLETMKSPLVGPPRRPEVVRVSDGLLAEEVRRILPEAEVVVAPTPELDQMLRNFAESGAGDDDREEPSYFEEGRVGKEAVEGLFRSAELLYKLAPWKVAADSLVLRVDIPDYGVEGACLSIIGALGQSLGLILFPSLADFDSFLEQAELPRRRGAPIDMGSSARCLNFEVGSDLPPRMLREALDHGWPVAGPKAYPIVYHHDRDGMLRPLTERDVRIMAACAVSLCAFYGKHRELFKQDEPEPICESYFDADDVEVRFTLPARAADLFQVNQPRRSRRGAATRPAVGRNQPCPCGSGKKYKLCCLPKESPEARDGTRDGQRDGQRDARRSAQRDAHRGAQPDAEEAPAAVHDLDHRLVERMDRYARSRFGPDWMARPARIFNDLSMPGALAGPWAFHHHRFDGKPIAEWFLIEQGSRVPEEDLRWLLAQRAAWLSIWEAVEVDPGRGLVLKDLLTGETRSVYEVSASKTLKRRDALLARVVDHRGQSVLCGVYHRSLPPRDAADVVERAQEKLRRKSEVPIERLRGEAIGRFLIQCWEEAIEEAELRASRPPELRNTDGDPLLFTIDHFAIDSTDRAEVRRRLAAIEGMEAESELRDPEPKDAEQVHVYTRPGNPMHAGWENTVIGRAVVKRNELRVETNSVKRADALRALVETSLGSLIRHRAREHADPLARLREDGPPEKPSAPRQASEEEDQLLLAVKAKHYADWIDQPIPALGNKTPRAAVRTKAGRQEVDLLLKECENCEARVPAGRRFDFSSIRRELGLGG